MKSEFFKHWGTGDEKWEPRTCNGAAQYVAEVARDELVSGDFNRKCFYSSKASHLSSYTLHFNGKQVNEKRSSRLQYQYQKDCCYFSERFYGGAYTLERLGSLSDPYKCIKEVRAREPENLCAWLGKLGSFCPKASVLDTIHSRLTISNVVIINTTCSTARRREISLTAKSI